MVGAPGVLSLSTEEDFAQVRQCLRQGNFSASGFMERFGVRATRDGFTRIHRNDLNDDLQSTLARLFVLGDSVKKERLIQSGINADVSAALERLDMVRNFSYAPTHYTSTVTLQPVGDIILASDRALGIGATSLKVSPDMVYSPLDKSAWQYMRFLPDTKCKHFLELCAGSGVAALHAATHFAKHAWACDISERATHFIEFNMRLNAVKNVTVVSGDLFDPLGSLVFDCIVAHPPYLPTLNNSTLFGGGGKIGDEILTRILQALSRHLVAGGLFYARAFVPDRISMSFEAHIRKTLGDQSGYFDILIMTFSDIFPLEFCNTMRWENRSSSLEAAQQLSIFKDNGIERLIDCVLVLHRRSNCGQTFTARYPLVDSKRLEKLLVKELTTVRSGAES